MTKMGQYAARLFGRGNIDLGDGIKVKPIRDYDVLRGVELIGNPVPVSYREMARCPRNKKLPKLDQLMDADFYHDTFYGKTVKEASKVIGEDLNLADRVVSSPLKINHVKDNVFVFVSDFANYEQAVQFLRENGNGQVSVRGGKPFVYDKSKGLILQEYSDGFDGLAQVAIFSKHVDFRRYFKTPKDMYGFNGDYTAKGLAQEIFEEHFRGPIAEKAGEIQDLKKAEVKGVLLSPVKTEIALVDGILTIGTSPKGGFLLGASYLI